MTRRNSLRFLLTDEQRAQIRAATGRDAEALELEVVELEERVAPGGPLSPRFSLLDPSLPPRTRPPDQPHGLTPGPG